MRQRLQILALIPLEASHWLFAAESRQPIGTVVVGGLLFSTVFNLLVTPVVHYVVTRVAERPGFSTIPPAVKLDIELPAHAEVPLAATDDRGLARFSASSREGDVRKHWLMRVRSVLFIEF